MRRREFVSGVAAGSIPAISGCVSDVPRFGSVRKETPINFDVSLFQTDVVSYSSLPATDSDYVLKQAKDLIESAFNTFTFEINVNVEISDYTVPESEFEDADDPLEVWDDLLSDSVPSSEISEDSNILLMNQYREDFGGRAEYPCSCSDVQAGVVYNTSDLYAVVESDIQVSEGFDIDWVRYPLIVHEVGHQLGLEHDFGKVIETRPDEKEIVTSVMIEGYSRELDDNHWGEDVFEQYDEEWTVYQTAKFNSRISEDDVVDAYYG